MKEPSSKEGKEIIKERHWQVKRILDKLNQIIGYQLNIEQAEKLHTLIHLPALDALYLSRTDTIYSVVRKKGKK